MCDLCKRPELEMHEPNRPRNLSPKLVKGCVMHLAHRPNFPDELTWLQQYGIGMPKNQLGPVDGHMPQV
eukprot:8002972-Alexandrium_andersonii.AAC.1